MTALRINPSHLVRARHERAMTQEQLAQAADVHPVTLARIETGKQVARSSTILALALALGLAPLDIASVVEVPRETADAVSP